MSAKQVRLIPLPAGVADGFGPRMAALRAIVECIAKSLEDEPDMARSASEALDGVAEEIERIYIDLDVCAWNEHEARELSS